MNRQFTICLLVVLIFGRSFGSGLVSEKEVIGCWKVDPSTFLVRSTMIPNTYPRPELPTNFMAFALWLHQDGSFVASNVPPGFFYHWPITNTNQFHGTWQLSTNRYANPNIDRYTLAIHFKKPSDGTWGMWSGPVIKLGSEKPSYQLPGAHDGEDVTGTYKWTLGLRKEQTGDKK